jgi:hypothetical protein
MVRRRVAPCDWLSRLETRRAVVHAACAGMRGSAHGRAIARWVRLLSGEVSCAMAAAASIQTFSREMRPSRNSNTCSTWMLMRRPLGLERSRTPGPYKARGPTTRPPEAPSAPSSSITEGELATPNRASQERYGDRGVAEWVTFCQILLLPTRRAERFWPPRTDRRAERASTQLKAPQVSAVGTLRRMAQVDPDQLAALQRLPAAFGHLDALEADLPSGSCYSL